MKIFVVLLFFSSLVQAQVNSEQTSDILFERIQFRVSPGVSESEEAQIRYTLNDELVSESLNETDFVITSIYIVSREHELSNSIANGTLFLSAGASPLLISDILASSNSFMKAEFYIEQNLERMRELMNQAITRLGEASNMEEVEDALTDLYFSFPISTKRVSEREFRERTQILLANQSLDEIKEQASGLSNSARTFWALRPFGVTRKIIEYNSRGGKFTTRAFIYMPFMVIMDIVMLPVTILMIPLTIM